MGGFDFQEDPTWRIFRIMSEFVDGFQFLSEFKKEVTFFGSARYEMKSEYYRMAEDLAKKLSVAGFSIITGGGPGIMEAGNKGAAEGKNGDSVGLNIQLPYEQRVNKYVKKGIGFHYFFTRKVMLSASAQAYVFFPGGFGTLDEFFEIITLLQTKKITEMIPVILMGQEFWEPLLKWIEDEVYKRNKAVDAEDLKLYRLTNSVEEAYKIILKSKERKFF
jgi:uncharacterized protein (TIGR00730 family)